MSSDAAEDRGREEWVRSPNCFVGSLIHMGIFVYMGVVYFIAHHRTHEHDDRQSKQTLGSETKPARICICLTMRKSCLFLHDFLADTSQIELSTHHQRMPQSQLAYKDLVASKVFRDVQLVSDTLTDAQVLIGPDTDDSAPSTSGFHSFAEPPHAPTGI
jgi:hypothetical protein